LDAFRAAGTVDFAAALTGLVVDVTGRAFVASACGLNSFVAWTSDLGLACTVSLFKGFRAA
jgi:hypothetical protein